VEETPKAAGAVGIEDGGYHHEAPGWTEGLVKQDI
jgi:hypothetical protein